jgi:putative tricarboxylic transport membrane protein
MSNNRTLGALALLMALVLAGFGWGLVAPFAYEPVGPRVFPLITATLIAVCGLILIIGGGGHAAPVSGSTALGLGFLVLTLLVYAMVFVRLGYVPSTLLMALIVARVFGATWWQGGVTATVLAVGSYLLFDHGLDVVLPTGIVGGLL